MFAKSHTWRIPNKKVSPEFKIPVDPILTLKPQSVNPEKYTQTPHP
jgi:hypothetical protein